MTDNKLETLVRAADNRLAQDISVLDVRELTPITDYFIIMHARNDRQLNAIVEEIIDVVNEEGYELKNVEGKREGNWILIDLNDIVVHVFHYTERATYNLENIWQDAKRIDVSNWITEQ